MLVVNITMHQMSHASCNKKTAQKYSLPVPLLENSRSGGQALTTSAICYLNNGSRSQIADEDC